MLGLTPDWYVPPCVPGVAAFPGLPPTMHKQLLEAAEEVLLRGHASVGQSSTIG